MLPCSGRAKSACCSGPEGTLTLQQTVNRPPLSAMASSSSPNTTGGESEDTRGGELDYSRVALVRDLIGCVPDFPKPGITFRDVFPVLRHPVGFPVLMSLLVDHAKLAGPFDAVLGLDARGFIFAPYVALKLGLPFVPVRKAGKLPGPVVRAAYELEYGKDVFETQQGSLRRGDRALILDDLVATGGSLAAACQLVKEMGAEVRECAVVIELVELRGRDKLPEGTRFWSLLQF